MGRSALVRYHLQDFNLPGYELPLNLTLAVVLCGDSGLGKTQLALAHFTYPVLIRRIEDLHGIGLRTDGLVFDDLSFRDWEPEPVIALLDTEQDSSIHCRYTDARIPANMPRIFTTNLTCENRYTTIFPDGKNEAQQYAIDRRFMRVGPITSDLRVTPVGAADDG